MESTNPATPYQSNPGMPPLTAARDASSHSDTIAGKFGSAAQAVKDQVGDRATETIDQARRKAGEFYDQANRAVNQQYDRVVSYSRENPGTTTLIAFGVGIGVGMLILGNLSGRRSHRSRVIEPVMSAVSTLASELFR